eukprot:scaffold189718_cov29-Tisochrysis_lutea.AAC.3
MAKQRVVTSATMITQYANSESGSSRGESAAVHTHDAIMSSKKSRSIMGLVTKATQARRKTLSGERRPRERSALC